MQAGETWRKGFELGRHQLEILEPAKETELFGPVRIAMPEWLVDLIIANHNEVQVLREALEAFPFVRKTVTSGTGEGLTRLAFKGDYDIPLDGQAISMILDWMEEHLEALTHPHNTQEGESSGSSTSSTA